MLQWDQGLPCAQSQPSHWAAQFTHTSCSSQNLPPVVKNPNSTCTALAANIPWARLAGCSSQRWGKWVQVAQGGCEPQPIDLMWITWERGSSIAKPSANHSDTVLRVFIACFIYLSQKPCLQQCKWMWISLSLPAKEPVKASVHLWTELQFTQVQKKYHPWHQWLLTEKGISQLTWASNRHAAMAKQMSISPGLTISASAFFILRAWSCFY